MKDNYIFVKITEVFDGVCFMLFMNSKNEVITGFKLKDNNSIPVEAFNFMRELKNIGFSVDY